MLSSPAVYQDLPCEAVELVGLQEIADILGVSRTRADQIVRQKGFPEPLDVIAAGRIWDKAEVLKWARESGRLK